MSVYTPLDEQQIQAFVANFDLPPPERFDGIKSGTVNSNFCLTYPDKKIILTIFEQLDEQTVYNYMALQDFLAQDKYPCPQPLRTKQHAWYALCENKPAVLVSFLPGQSCLNPTPEQCEQAGLYMAKLHLLTANYAQRLQNPLGFDWRNHSMKIIWDQVHPDDHTLMQNIQAKHNALPWADLPKAIIHNDCFRDNVHFIDNQLTGVIDFYYAAWDCCLFDLCIAINDWCTRWEQNSVELSTLKFEHFLNGYESERKLSKVEKDNFNTMLKIAAWHFWIYRLFVNRHKKKSPMITIKDPNEFRLMLIERLKEL